MQDVSYTVARAAPIDSGGGLHETGIGGRSGPDHAADPEIETMEPHEHRQTPPMPTPPPRMDGERLRVFVVEDSPVIRENLSATLEEMLPAQVVGMADSEAAAIAWLDAHADDCDLVTVDIFLKGGSGLGVLKAMRESGSPHRIVVLSNYATPDMRRRCLELGADRVFDKSGDVEALLAYCEGLGPARRRQKTHVQGEHQ